MDDSILRLCVALLNFEEVFAEKSTDEKSHPLQIKLLCEYLSSNLMKPISLTDMEEISGLSARVLQYTFQKLFELRPKEWLRKQRLHAARQVLEKTEQQIKLTTVAYDFCFASPSHFAKHYKAQFGELPSQTVARKKSIILP
jgi:AraC family ethanolamine operon transcriptional activator